MTMTRWFDRTFEFGLPPSALPDILERLRRAPVRVREVLERTPAGIRTQRVDGRWSVQEHAGHLLDLEALWLRRLEDLAAGRPSLHPADLDNRRTHEAGHNARDPREIADGFETARAALLARAAALDAAQLAHTAVHPRLQRPMSAVDHCYFIAEHDDHHLEIMQTMVRELT